MEIRVTNLESPEANHEVMVWFTDYLSHQHELIGRSGSVCPFVKPALQAKTLVMDVAHFQEQHGLKELCMLMRQQIDRFTNLQWADDKTSIRTLVTLIATMPEHLGILLDEAQRRTKEYAVNKGLMIGQFHPHCPEPAVHNPDFPVARAPEMLFAIRPMAIHDILFLHPHPAMFAEYQKRFAHRYDSPDSSVPEDYAHLYNLAQQRGRGRGEYIDYQSIDLLLSLQHPHTDHPSEMVFYLTGQVKELLFKLVYEQTRAVRLSLVKDNVGNAIWEMRRITAGLNVLIRVWDILDTLAPTEFNAFREQLKGASGIDSYMFRMVEFSLGHKSARLAARYVDIPGVAEEVYRTLNDTSVYDEALALLCRKGLLSLEIFSPTITANADVITNAWADIYRTKGPGDELFLLAEALIDVAEMFARWRTLHQLTVERMIGSKTGTGGTDGIGWLRRTAEHRFFPELWAARTLLSAGPAPF